MKTYFFNAQLLVLFVFASFSISAQSVWDGSGDGTSWDDPLNWEDDLIPADGAIVTIGKNAVITGSIVNNPNQVKISGKADVTFNLDMSVGTTSSEEHAFTIGTLTNVVFGPFNFNITTTENKQGLANFASGDSAVVEVMADAVLNFNNTVTGINIAGPQSQFTNNGTLNFNSSVKTAIKTLGSFENGGSIDIQSTIADGISQTGGIFTNMEEGEISIDKCGDDGIEITEGGVFENNGIIDIVAVDEANSSKNALAIGNAMSEGYFANNTTGMLIADGGTGSAARAISIFELGGLSNAGTISTFGGNDGARIYSKNEVHNAKGGYINLNDGRINVNVGTLVNDGFIETTRSGSGIFLKENTIATNNAFFRYDSSGVFGSGNGTVVENGLKLNNIYRFKLDAQGACDIDIAEVAYDWTINDTYYSSSAEDGAFSFAPNSIAADSVVLKTSLPEVNIKVINICAEAVMTTGITEELNPANVRIFPSLQIQGQPIQIETDCTTAYKLVVYNLEGQLILQKNANSKSINLNTDELNTGNYLLSVYNGTGVQTTQFSIIK